MLPVRSLVNLNDNIPASTSLWLCEEVNATFFEFDDLLPFGESESDKREGGFDLFGLEESPVGIVLFAAICGLVYYYQTQGIVSSEAFGLQPSQIFGNFEYYRFLTNNFLHNSANHLCANLLGIMIYGKACELKFGTIGLLEATLWAMLLESVWVIFLTIIFPSLRNRNAIGFSMIIFFWEGMTATPDYLEDQRKMVYFALLVWDEIHSIFQGKLGSIFHLLGFVNGLFYNHFIAENFTLPTKLYSHLEQRMSDFVSNLCENVGLQGLLYFVESVPEDEEGYEEDTSEDEQEHISEMRREFARQIVSRLLSEAWNEEDLQPEIEDMLRAGQLYVYPPSFAWFH